MTVREENEGKAENQSVIRVGSHFKSRSNMAGDDRTLEFVARLGWKLHWLIETNAATGQPGLQLTDFDHRRAQVPG
jgi:hypothetical protein